MATTHWRCEKCETVDTPEVFNVADLENRQCPNPKCKDEDVFSFRLFKCLGCGFCGDQIEFFGNFNDAPLDEDPIENKWDYECPRETPGGDVCGGKEYKQIPLPKKYSNKRCFFTRLHPHPEDESRRKEREERQRSFGY